MEISRPIEHRRSRQNRSKGPPHTRVDWATLKPWDWAWRTILVLISVTVLLSILALLHDWIGPLPKPKISDDGPRPGGPVAPDPLGACELRQQAEREWIAFSGAVTAARVAANRKSHPRWDRRGVCPRSTQASPSSSTGTIRSSGRYVELGQAAFGKLEEEFSVRLFAGLQERIANASADVDQTMREEMRALVEQWVRDQGQMLPTEALRTAYERMLGATIADTVQRFTVSGPSIRSCSRRRWRCRHGRYRSRRQRSGEEADGIDGPEDCRQSSLQGRQPLGRRSSRRGRWRLSWTGRRRGWRDRRRSSVAGSRRRGREHRRAPQSKCLRTRADRAGRRIEGTGQECTVSRRRRSQGGGACGARLGAGARLL